MKRGDVVLSVLQGDLGKPRPAVIVQANELGLDRLTVIICPVTSAVEATGAFRPVVFPSRLNGLRAPSIVMTDKIIAVRRERLRQVIGELAHEDIQHLERALILVLGLGTSGPSPAGAI